MAVQNSGPNEYGNKSVKREKGYGSVGSMKLIVSWEMRNCINLMYGTHCMPLCGARVLHLIRYICFMA